MRLNLAKHLHNIQRVSKISHGIGKNNVRSKEDRGFTGLKPGTASLQWRDAHYHELPFIFPRSTYRSGGQLHGLDG